MARIDALQRRQERAREAKAREAAHQQTTSRMTELEQRAALAEQLSDPEAFLAHAEKIGVAPERLAAFLRGAVESPEEHAAKRAASKVQTAVDARIAELETRLAKAEEERQGAIAADAERKATEQFVGIVSASASQAPLFSAFLESQRDAALEVANNIAAALPPGSTMEDVLLHAETLLGRFQVQPKSPSKPTIPAQKSPASAPAPKPRSLSTSAIAGGPTHTEDLSGLSFDERARRIAQKYGVRD